MVKERRCLKGSGNGLADINGAGDDNPVNRRADDGVAQVRLCLHKCPAGLGDTPFGRFDRGLCRLPGSFGKIEIPLGNYPVSKKFSVALQSPLGIGQINLCLLADLPRH